MTRKSSLEDFLISTYKDIEKRYPKTEDNPSDILRVRYIHVLCNNHIPKITRYNIRKITGITEDWLKSVRKGNNSSIENAIVFALYTISSYEDVLEFLFLFDFLLHPYSHNDKCVVYFYAIQKVYQESITDGRERCKYLNKYLIQNGWYAINNDL